MTSAPPALLWIRQDLRLADNPALHQALLGPDGRRPVLPVYVLDEAGAGAWAPGGAARWWLHHSLQSLAQGYAAHRAPLLLARGRAETVIPALADAIGAVEVHAARAAEPWARAQHRRVREALRDAGRALHLHPGPLLHAPEKVATGTGRPYGVYAPFAKNLLGQGDPPAPLPAPAAIPAPTLPPGGESLAEWRLLPQPPVPDWAARFATRWQPGEAGAQARLDRFAGRALSGYARGRELPGVEGTSGLSPHLRWGEVSPRQVWHAAKQAAAADRSRSGIETFLKELLWREFAAHLLWHRPEMPEAPLRADFARFPARPDPALLRAWQRGRTGYPIVDAGMRQLWALGWMHNRVRMICASLLVKQLLQPWQDGQAWFWDTLVDADLATNAASWQWIAGCGTDASPYFRVFNPVLQGRKFDADGAYVRAWVPELSRLPDRWIHDPWDAPAEVLGEAGLRLGLDYPRPLVEPAEGRARALAAFAEMRGRNGQPAGTDPAGPDEEDATLRAEDEA